MLGLTTWFAVGTLGMVVGTLVLAYGAVLVPTERRRFVALAASVPGIAAVAYGLMSVGLGGFTTASGSTVFVPRYVDWLLTTPIHIAFIALLVGASTGLIARLATLQALTIVFGFIGATLSAPLNWALYLAGSACFAGVIYLLYAEADALATDQSDEVVALFRKLRAFVVILWLVYPVIWLLGSTGLAIMDLETGALVVTYIDVVSKVGFGLIAINDFVSMAHASDDTAASETDLPDAARTAD